MSLFPEGMPAPTPTADDAGFWVHCREHRLCFQACADCARVRHPPLPVCGHCGSMRTLWKEAPATGQLYSYSIAHHPSLEILRNHPPYVIALVIFPTLDDVRLVTNILDADPSVLHIGAAVTLVWEAASNGIPLPRFRLQAV